VQLTYLELTARIFGETIRDYQPSNSTTRNDEIVSCIRCDFGRDYSSKLAQVFIRAGAHLNGQQGGNDQSRKHLETLFLRALGKAGT
jgi:hypothetical protein